LAQAIATLLSDRQIRFGKEREAFWRRAYRVVSSTGVENGSQIEWSFDPTYERLVVHFVRIHRGGAGCGFQKDWHLGFLPSRPQFGTSASACGSGSLSGLAPRGM
jgi:hypothetical protein